MNKIRIKVYKIRKKLSKIQYEIIDMAYKYRVHDFKDPRLKQKCDEAFIMEIVLDEWINRYKEEQMLFWNEKNRLFWDEENKLFLDN